MKKILPILVLTGLSVFMLMPAMVSADVLPTGCPIRANVSDYIPACTTTSPDICLYTSTTEPCALCCLMGLIVWVTDIIFTVLIVLIIISVILAGFQFVTAAGDPSKLTTARNVLLIAIVAIGVAALAKAVPQIVKYLLGAT